MTFFLDWLRAQHDPHQCLMSIPSKWPVDCERPQAGSLLFLNCDACKYIPRNVKKPDYILFLDRHSELLVIVLELTEGRVYFQKCEQVEAGLAILKDFIENYRMSGHVPTLKLSIEAFILHNSSVRSADLQRLRRMPLKFQGKNCPLHVDRCGRKLRELLARESLAT